MMVLCKKMLSTSIYKNRRNRNRKHGHKFVSIFAKLDSEKNKLLESKEREIQELNDKYRGYLEKAKIVIKSLDPLTDKR